MKPLEDTEDFVRRGKASVTTGPQMDKRILDDSFAAMDENIAGGRLNDARMMLRRRAVGLAVAALMVVGIGLLSNQLGPPEQEPPSVERTAKSPADMLSAISLNMAYRRGGIEEVDEVSAQAFKELGSRPAAVSLRELRPLTESNGA